MPTEQRLFKHDLMVVGLQFRNKKDERELLATRCKSGSGFPVVLVREQENKYDGNAIAVKMTKAYGGKHIGYLGRESAAVLAPLMDRGELVFKDAVLKEVTGHSFNEGLAAVTFVDKR